MNTFIVVYLIVSSLIFIYNYFSYETWTLKDKILNAFVYSFIEAVLMFSVFILFLLASPLFFLYMFIFEKGVSFEAKPIKDGGPKPFNFPIELDINRKKS